MLLRNFWIDLCLFLQIFSVLQNTVAIVDSMSIFLTNDQDLGEPEIVVEYDQLTLTVAKEPASSLRNASFTSKLGSLVVNGLEGGANVSASNCLERKVQLQNEHLCEPFTCTNYICFRYTETVSSILCVSDEKDHMGTNIGRFHFKCWYISDEVGLKTTTPVEGPGDPPCIITREHLWRRKR